MTVRTWLPDADPAFDGDLSALGHTRRTTQWLVTAVVAVAVLVRLGPLLVHGSLGGLLEQDDGVHFVAAQQLIRGHLPYRDFLFVQPPGVLVLLAPFAALGRAIGDGWAFTLARLFFIGIAAANAGLIVVLLRRFGATAAAAGGLVYATWGLSASAEHTLLLEPVLNLLLLLALRRLDGEMTRRAARVAGALLGAAVAVKLFAVPETLFLGWWLWCRHGREIARAWLSGVIATLTLLMAPFFAAAPTAIWRDIVALQAGRPATSSPLPTFAVVALWALVLAVFVLAAAPIAAPRQRPVLWGSIALLATVEVVLSPSFYYHYTDFIAPAACLFGGWLVAAAAAHLTRPTHIFVVAAGLAIVTIFGAATWNSTIRTHTNLDVMTSFAAGHRCVWAATPALLVMANASDRNIAHGCPVPVDPFAQYLASVGDTRSLDTPALARRVEPFQVDTRAALNGSDAALTTGDISAQPWSAETRALFVSRFHRVATLEGAIILWTAS